MTPSTQPRHQLVAVAAAVIAHSMISVTVWANDRSGYVDVGPSPADTTWQWPAVDEVMGVLLLRDYNTRLVVLSTVVLGAAGGLVGVFLLLRKRSLMGDALSHATLPGIGVAFMVMAALGGDGKWLPGLLAGAAVSGLAGVAAVLMMIKTTRLGDDTAMGVVLSVFFGLGTVLLGVIQTMPQGNAAGLESFIYGKTASIVYDDFLLIGGVCAVVVVTCVLFFKELRLLCFDEGYAQTLGWSIWFLDLLMLALVTAVTVIGLQAVGLILVIALLIIPAAAARFWTHGFLQTAAVSAAIGGLSGWLGASLSALIPDMPAGAVIVLVCSTLFLASMLVGTSRGVLIRAAAHWRLIGKVGHQHLLRTVFEVLESHQASVGRVTAGWGVSFDDLLAARSWTRRRLHRLLARAQRDGLVEKADGDQQYRLTQAGTQAAGRVVRNHRLWEMYLITHADIAPSHVDRDADQIEHVLGPELIRKLEGLLQSKAMDAAVPPSPHAV